MSEKKNKGKKGKTEKAPVRYWSEYTFATLERMIAPSLLPREEHTTALKIIRLFKEECSFSEEELWILQIVRTPEGQLFWQDSREVLDAEGKGTGEILEVKPKKLIVGNTIKQLIIDKLQAMEAANPCQINESHLGLWELFIGPINNDELKDLEEAMAARKAMEEAIAKQTGQGEQEDQAAG